MPDFKINFGFVPVPYDFIENHMTDANGAYIKVYLFALSLAAKGNYMSNADIAKKLKLLESDVVNAFSYWMEKGVLNINNEIIMFGGEVADTIIENEPAPVIEKNRRSAESISEMMEHNKDLADLCAVSQEIFGRVLTKTEIETIYWFYDELNFSPDIIAMLLEYCVSINKTNISYIEKVAIEWDKKGIKTMKAATDFMTNEEKKKSSSYEIKRAIGLNDRDFTKTEEGFIKTWQEKYHMSNEMIVFAYELCVLRTNKLSFPYMDSIIQNWDKKKIYSIEAAQKDQEDFKAKNKKFEQKDTSVYEQGDYDNSYIEKLMREKYNN